MLNYIRSLLLFSVTLVALNAQAQSDQKELTKTTGSISGRVTLGGKPAAGVKVTAFKRGHPSPNESVASTKTDQDGYFQLNKLPSDHYNIIPLAPAYIASEQAALERPGKDVSLAEGETIEEFDFTLVRGGVITGRVTDKQGQPITGEQIKLIQLDPNGQKRPIFYFPVYAQFYFRTDDRGIYRIYGLHPGRYLVSVGEETGQGAGRVGGARYHPHTFYPSVTDESKASIVELTAGAVITGIDIAIGHSVKTYSASGRVIDASTAKPVPNAQFGHGMIRESISGNSSSLSSSFSGGLKADARGNFRLDGLLPGTFYVIATPDAESSQYSNVASFQVKDQDITGLEIKISRGSSISGVLVVDGTNDPEVIARLPRLRLWASVTSPDIIRGVSMSRQGTVSPDGGFNIAGLHPGKISLHIFQNADSKGLYVSRVERSGVEYSNEIEVRPGENVSGVRVILGYASGRIRGQVKIESGKLPPGAKIYVFVSREDGPRGQSFPHIQVDPNGRFVVEDLIAGEYELSVTVEPPLPPEGGTFRQLAESVSKRVSVTNGGESEVIFVVELIDKNKDN